MKASLELDVDNARDVYRVVEPDLQDSGRVSFDVSVDESLQVDVEADSLGALRGALNTATKLSKLGSRMLGD